MASLDHPDRF
jgi:hypothetical protein